MTRNQKIALGCGGAGCLGLIVVVVAGCLIWFFAYRQSSNTNRYGDDNFNRNSNRTANLNSNDNADDSTNSDSSSSTADTSLSDDERHRLFQAAVITGDLQLQRRVWVKIGIVEDDFSQGDKYYNFAAEHGRWVLENLEWVGSMDSAEKGRAYIDEHLD